MTEMADWDEKEWNGFNHNVIEAFRTAGGKLGGSFEGSAVLLLTTIGAKSGQNRTKPLMYLPYNDRFVIFATKGGAATRPDWYHNLMAHPKATIEVGTETFEVTASVVTGELRDQLYAAQAQREPAFIKYEEMIAHEIPVVLLERRAA